ncbi:MAG: hypothetical protein ACJ8AC_08300, partial [Gemmatimonadaceae bacterium]
RRYVDSREPLPVNEVMRLAGLRTQSDTVRELRLGISTSTDSSGVAVTQASPTGAAAAAGVRTSDRLVSIGDVMFSNDDSFAALRARYAGTALTTLPLVIRRGAETTSLQLPVRLFPRTRTTVTPIPGASEKAIRIRQGILKGSTS